MTSEELKQQIKMPELMRQYGVNIRNNMCRCPFHGEDRHPSMKVFNNGANCFTCGWNGDIFKFVMEMEHCDFKSAYLRLGGEYEKKTKKAKVLEHRTFAKAKDIMRQKENIRRHQLEDITFCIDILLGIIRIYEPYSDNWCEAHNDLEPMYALYLDIQGRKEIDNDYVIRKCKQIRSKYLTVG